MILSESERETVYYSLITPCTLSILGCLFILLMFSLCSSLRALPFKLISLLSLFDLINAVAFLIPTYDLEKSRFNCKIQAILLNFSSLAGLLWSTFMAMFLYMAIKYSRTFEEKTVIKVAAGILLACLIDTLIPFFVHEDDAYGEIKGWCWIKDQHLILRYCLFFVPMGIMIIINFYFYVKIRIVLNSFAQVGNTSNKKLKRIKNKLLFYPVIIIICYLPYSIKALMEETNSIDMYSDYVFTIVVAILRCLHGFFNFLIYGLTDAVREKLKNFLNTKKDNSVISLEQQTIL